MMRRWGAPLLTAVLVAPACKGSSQGALRELTTPIEQLAVPPPCSPTSSFGLDTVAWGLDVPWALDFTPDDRILITERVGRIRLVEDGVLRREPWATLDVRADDEAGLMGLAVSPDFAETGHVYVVGTFYAAPESGPLKVLDRAYRRLVGQLRNSIAIPYENRVYRLTDRDGHGVEPQLVIDGLRAARLHAGGALAFGPDGMLYVAVGEALDGDAAQSLDMLLGKVLRYRPDGTIPDDNPLSGSPVYAYGFRNVQGLVWQPETGDLFATDHGPSGLPWEAWGSGRDELNLLTPAGNFGWSARAALALLKYQLHPYSHSLPLGWRDGSSWATRRGTPGALSTIASRRRGAVAPSPSHLTPQTLF